MFRSLTLTLSERQAIVYGPRPKHASVKMRVNSPGSLALRDMSTWQSRDLRGPLLTNLRRTCYKRLTAHEFHMKKLCPNLAILLLALGFMAGCAASPYRLYPQYEGPSREPPSHFPVSVRTHPQYEERSRSIRSVALMPPDAKVYGLTAGDKRDLVDEWSETARKNLAQSMATHGGTAGQFVLKAFDPAGSPSTRQEYEDARPLFEAVSLSALAHAYGGDFGFKTKQERFEYSLGPLTSLAEVTQADALLFVWANDYISTGGRKALIGLLGTMLLLPPYTIFGVAALASSGGPTLVVTALVEAKTGEVLWFGTHSSRAYDLRDSASAQSLLCDVFNELGQIAPFKKVQNEKCKVVRPVPSRPPW